jgi:aminopeptidase N
VSRALKVEPASGWPRTARQASVVSALLAGAMTLTSTVFAAPAPAAVAVPDFDVLHYSVDLTPDINSRQVDGKVTITVRGIDQPVSELQFDAGDLQVSEVRDGGLALMHSKAGPSLRITLRQPLGADEVRSISIAYHGSPVRGLEFHPEHGEMYTIFSTSQWMPCVDAPSERATLELAVRLPPDMKAVGTGHAVSPSDGASVHRWQLDTPMPSYLYGFAAGRYNEFARNANGFTLRFLSTDRSPRQLEQIFRDSPDMLQFFGTRAGVGIHHTYTQVLVTRTVGQEMAGLSLLSEAYGLQLLDDPANGALMAHEAAHQWWGNLLTARDWRHFWLNEGFATFMSAAYLEHRHGTDAYLKQVDAWRRRVEKLRAEGKDKPLVFPDWNAPTGDDRAVVYQKGAYVLHLLRQDLGDKAFWNGIREYTREHAGRSVVTEDFQSAMEKAAGRSLAGFFSVWVSG